jgi:hypothetical protein
LSSWSVTWQHLESERADWKALWSKISDIRDAFKNTRYPSRERREAGGSASAPMRFCTSHERGPLLQAMLRELQANNCELPRMLRWALERAERSQVVAKANNE